MTRASNQLLSFKLNGPSIEGNLFFNPLHLKQKVVMACFQDFTYVSLVTTIVGNCLDKRCAVWRVVRNTYILFCSNNLPKVCMTHSLSSNHVTDDLTASRPNQEYLHKQTYMYKNGSSCNNPVTPSNGDKHLGLVWCTPHLFETTEVS